MRHAKVFATWDTTVLAIAALRKLKQKGKIRIAGKDVAIDGHMVLAPPEKV
jgi:hypothetical protein